MPGLMDGYRVLDLTWGLAGPVAGMLFSDAGADVIKVEPPGGDPFRKLIPYRVWNRGKRSITLDLAKAEGRDLFYRLASPADVLLESFQPRKTEELGIGYAELHARFPRLVYTSVTGYGHVGPRIDRPGYDALVSARMGIQAEQPSREPGPHLNAFPMSSYGASLLAVIGTTAALWARLATGRGQHVDTSMEDGVLAMSSMNWGWAERAGLRPGGGSGAGASTITRRLMAGMQECADGKFLQLHTGAPGRFQKLMGVLGLDDRIAPSSSPHEMGLPLTPEESAIIGEEVPRLFRGKPRHEWIAMLEQADIAVMAVDPPGVILDDPQVVHNGAVMMVDDPELGKIKTVGPIMMSPGAPAAVRGPAPLPGEHTDVLLREVGVSDREIGQLRERGVV